MSYDLMVFDPSHAPRGQTEFLDWAAEQMGWPEEHRYDDPKISSPALQHWLDAMRQTFPSMNDRLMMKIWRT